MSRWVVVLSLVGCGRVGFDDVSRDASVADAADAGCAAFGPWSAPTLALELSSTSEDYDPALSEDGLSVVLTSERAGDRDLYRSTRASRTAPWSTPVPIPELATATSEEGNASISPNGLEIYFGISTVFRMTRATINDPFGGIVEILPGGAAYSSTIGPEISHDGLDLYFAAIPASGTYRQMYRIHRASLTSPFQNAQRLPILDDTVQNGFMTITADGLELYYSRDVPSWEIRRMTRASTAVELDPTTDERVDVMNTSSNDADPDVSADGLEMLFNSDRPGGLGLYDIYSTTRECL